MISIASKFSEVETHWSISPLLRLGEFAGAYTMSNQSISHVESAAGQMVPGSTESTTPMSRSVAIRLWLRSVGPTAAVVCALAALAIWGNHVGWSLPKFSALFTSGNGQVADWCQEHNVPES